MDRYKQSFLVDNYFSRKYLIQNFILEDLTNAIIKNSGSFSKTFLVDPSQYINGVYLWPISLYLYLDNPQSTPIRISNVTFDEYKGYLITGENTYNFYSAGYRYFPNNNLTFIDYMQQVELYLPFVGLITLDITELIGRNVYVLYSLDFESGFITYYINRSTAIYDNETEAYNSAMTGNPYFYTINIYTTTVQCAIKVPIGSSSQNEANLKGTLGIISGSLGVLQGASNMVVGGVSLAMTGGALGGGNMVQGGSQILNSGMNIVSNAIEMNRPHYSRGSAQGGYSSSFAQDLYVRFIIRRPVLPEGFTWEGFASTYGRPLEEYHLLSDCTGFTTVGGEIHLETLDCLPSEKDEIESFLRSGIII